jgi:hypothetical protein
MNEDKRPTDHRNRRSLIGAIIAALDDRNLGAALRVLKPERESGCEEQEPACGGRCVTRGE